MPLYRQIVDVEAARWDGTVCGVVRVEQDIGEISSRLVKCGAGVEWFLDTHRGPLKVNPGEWILKSVDGDFYTMSNDIFVTSFTEV